MFSRNPSLLAVSQVKESRCFSLTDAALYVGPTGDNPVDNTALNRVSPVPTQKYEEIFGEWMELSDHTNEYSRSEQAQKATKK